MHELFPWGSYDDPVPSLQEDKFSKNGSCSLQTSEIPSSIQLIEDQFGSTNYYNNGNHFQSQSTFSSPGDKRTVHECAEVPCYSCPNCFKKYATKYTLLRHIKFECGKEPQFQCMQCFKRFKHKKITYENGWFPSDGQDLEIYERNQRVGAFRTSLSQSHCETSGAYKCLKCSRTYSWKKSLVLHLHSSWESYYSDRQFFPGSSFHTDPIVIINEDVQDTNSTMKSSSTKNSNKWVSDNGFGCPACGKVYRWKNNLYRHLKLECGKEPQFHCPYCPHRAKRKGNLQKHIELKHLRIKETNVQQQAIFSEENQKKHLLKIEDHQDTGMVLFHQSSYQGGSSYTPSPTKMDGSGNNLAQDGHRCTQCGKSYRWKKQLSWSGQDSSRVLNPEFLERLFESTSSFNQQLPDFAGGGKSDLQQSHLQSARGLAKIISEDQQSENGFKCRNCGKLYRWKNSLYTHVRLECGKEPQFQCPYCPHRAKLKGNLQKHIKLKHFQDYIFTIFINFLSDLDFWTNQHHSRKYSVGRFTNFETLEPAFQNTRFNQQRELQHQSTVCASQPIMMDQRFYDTTANSRFSNEGFLCTNCGKTYRWKKSLYNHVKLECGKEPQFQCPYCPHRAKLRQYLQSSFTEEMDLGTCYTYGSYIQPQEERYAFTSIKENKKTFSSNKEFQCGKCGKNYRWKESLYNHQKLMCEILLWSHHLLAKPSEALDTILLEEGSEPLQFNKDIDYQGDKKGSRVRQRDASHRAFNCKNCGKSYRWINSLYKHLQLECGKEPQFHCPFCPHRAKRKWNLQTHIRVRHASLVQFIDEVRNMTSFLYGTIVDTVGELQQHHVQGTPTCPSNSEIQMYNYCSVSGDNGTNEQDLFPCPSCLKVYRWKKSLHLHMRYECGKEPQFHCPYCPYKAKIKGNLITHIKRKHICGNDTRERVLSSSWSKSFGATNFRVFSMEMNNQRNNPRSSNVVSCALQNSAKSSPTSEEHQCNRCGKIYRWKKSLNLHLRVECGKDPQFQCPICPYKAKQKGNLKSHVRVLHSDQVKTLSAKLELLWVNKSRHFSTQNRPSEDDERKFQNIGDANNHDQRENISKETVAIKSLWQHQQNCKTYIGAFKCPSCGKTYRWKQSMMSHYRNECGKDPRFSCPLCPYKCKQKGNLKSHIRGLVRDKSGRLHQPWHLSSVQKLLGKNTSIAGSSALTGSKLKEAAMRLSNWQLYGGLRKSNIRSNSTASEGRSSSSVKVSIMRDASLTSSSSLSGSNLLSSGTSGSRSNLLLGSHLSSIRPVFQSQKYTASDWKKPGAYRCPSCGKLYRWKKNLISHRRLECGKEPQLQCPYCPHRTKHKSSLIKHVDRNDDKKLGMEEELVTEFDDSVFTTDGSVLFCKLYEVKVSAEKQLVGTWSDTNENSPATIVWQQPAFFQTDIPIITRTYSTMEKQTRPYACSTCHKTYTHKSNLGRFTAEFGATFSSPQDSLSLLKFTSFVTPRHIGSDRTSGPYSCPNCNKVYQHRPSLSQHLKHECGKEPQFQCPFCPQRTTQKGSLRKHIRRRHSFVSQ
ncbi:hypothetical protein C0J52_13312 [Blattella germanica]|nr:hypothetical protein C0J52_13312 [Blattella germanica]